MSTAEDTEYTLTPKANHGGLFAGLAIAVLALLAVFFYHSWLSSSPAPEATAYQYQFVSDLAPFRAIVANTEVSPEQTRTDTAYFNSLQADPAILAYIAGEIEVEQLPENDYDSDDEMLVNNVTTDPFTLEILGISLELAYNAPVGSEFRELIVPVFNELAILIRDTQNPARLTARERFPSTEQYELPYTSVLMYRYPSSHVALAFLARDLGLGVTAMDESTRDFYLAEANRELKLFIDSGIVLGLYTLSDVQVTERFYRTFIEQVRVQSPYNEVVPAFIPLYTL